MQRFHVIDDAAVILRRKGGLYGQAKVYRRGQDVFAAIGAGFVRLLGGSGTTSPNVSWLDLEAEGVELTNSSKTPKFVGEGAEE